MESSKHPKNESSQSNATDHNNGSYRLKSSSGRLEGRWREDSNLNDKTRISFLNQCKLELSSEVIRWKEENFRLRKENEAAIKRIEELESALNKISRQSKELETSLFLSQEDNKRLKMRTLAIGEENSMLHERLTKSRFHSYPWIEIANRNHTHSYQEVPCFDNPTPEASESLEEVSRKLFKQMEQEISEMEKYGQSLAVHNQPTLQLHTPESQMDSNANQPSEEELNEETAAEMGDATRRVKSLLQEVNTLKHHLKFQNEKLQFLLNQTLKANESKSNSFFCDKKSTIPSSLKATGNTLPSSSRPPDETVRAYFTQQLNSCKNNEETKKGAAAPLSTEHDLQRSSSGKRLDKNMSPASHRPQSKQQTKMSFSAEQSKPPNQVTEDDRVCPICKTTFPQMVPQQDFEAHVIEHLEIVGASLLNEIV